ncbi:hypothetical protein D3C71_2124490 [compost metagenome]
MVHIARNRRFEMHELAGARMLEAKHRRMQRLPLKRDRLIASIHRVPGQRIANIF